MSVLANDRLLRALAREPVDRTPVWIMRQAGRYLPEYRATRAEAGSFLGWRRIPSSPAKSRCSRSRASARCRDPLLRHPDDPESHGRRARVRGRRGAAHRAAAAQRRRHRRAAGARSRAASCGSSWMRSRSSAASSLGACRSSAFAGSPWTVATYMRRGRRQPRVRAVEGAARERPAGAAPAARQSSRATTDYLNAQVEAGAQAVMIFDTWGGVLSTPEYLEFSLAYMERIAAGLQRERDGRRVPLILFTKGGGAWLASMAATGADALGIDWTTELSAARQAVGDRVALQGNLDPGGAVRIARGDPRPRRTRARKLRPRPQDTSSTSATASSPVSIPTTSPRWWPPCTSCRPRITAREKALLDFLRSFGNRGASASRQR